MALSRNRAVHTMNLHLWAGWRGPEFRRAWRVLGVSTTGRVFETYLGGGPDDWERVLIEARKTWNAQVGWSRVSKPPLTRLETPIDPPKGKKGHSPDIQGKYLIGWKTEVFPAVKPSTPRVARADKAMAAYMAIPRLAK